VENYAIEIKCLKKTLKIYFLNLISFWQLVQIKLNTNYPSVKGIQVYSNKGPSPLQRGDNPKNVKMG
jgi:hypothetical protein